MEGNKNILIMGLPSSGKTTFIAALQHYLVADIPSKKLRQYKYSSNSEYLNLIHGRWLNFEEQSRTSQELSGNRKVEMFLEKVSSNHRFQLSIPDLAGEIFSQQWDIRRWDQEYLEMLNLCSGLIYFLHPSNLKPHVLLTDILHLADSYEGADPADIKEWSAETVPTQVISVELLQFHLNQLKRIVPIPIAFIISAWDKVKNAEMPITPADWLKNNLPLLNQFLESNAESIHFKVFGVSAQGGEYKDGQASEELLRLDEPADRIIVQDGKDENNEIGEPLFWLIDSWKS